MTQLTKIAHALDLLADEWDRAPTAAAPEPTPDPLAHVLAAELGDRWTPALAQKLAEDASLRELLEPLAKQAASAREAPRPMGGAVEKTGGAAVRRTPAEERAEAEAYFAMRLMEHASH